jgi:hypothetical protein
MLMAIAAGTAEPIGPARLLQWPHIAPRSRRAAGTQAGRDLSGAGSRCGR